MTFPTTEEHERPAEWLSTLMSPGGYQALLTETASLPIAAYRLARAVCRVRPVTMAVPTLRELATAARTLAEACHVTVPSAAALLDACAEAGLLVIEPLRRAAGPRESRMPGIGRDAPAYAY